MDFEAFNTAALALPGAELDIKWGQDRVYCVGGKMFAVAGQLGETHPRFCLKVTDMAFDLLCETGAAEPAPYLARAKWVLFKSGDAIPDDQLAAYLRMAHGLIAAKLPKKTRVELKID